MKKILALLLAMAMVFSLVACGSNEPAADDGADEDKSWNIAVVPKEVTAEWFQRLEVGVDDFQADHPELTITYKGPDTTDAALQYAVVEDLIASGVDAICVTPIDSASLDGLFQQAREQGIIVITHEGNSAGNVDYDVAAFDNTAYGEFMMECLAEQMGYKGTYVSMVGSLTNDSHMEWARAGIAYQQEKYPDMAVIEEDMFVEMNDDVDECMNKIKELIKKYPDMTGIYGTSGHVAPVAAQLFTEMDLIGKMFTVGVSQPNRSREFVENGALKYSICWDPAAAAYTMCEVAMIMLNGGEITDGMALTAEGYDSVTVVDKQITGAGWITESVDNNLGKYDF